MRTPPLPVRVAALGAVAIVSLSAARLHAQSSEGVDLRHSGAAPAASASPGPAPIPPAVPPVAAMRWKWRSPALVAAGIGGIVVGVPTMLLGGLSMALVSGPYNEGANQTVNLLVTGGITATGGAFIACGILGIVHGSAPVPVADERSSLFPSIAVGPRSGSLTWHF